MWWDLADRRELAVRPALTGDLSVRTAIVGSGIAGLSLAVALARLGDDVTVLERDHAAGGATGRNAGFLLCDSECLSLAAAMHGDAAALALHAAGLATRGFVRGLEGPRFCVNWCGSVRLAADRGEARHFAATARRGLDGVRIEDALTAREAGSAAYLVALADDGDGMLDPLALVGALLREADARGVRRFDETPVLALRHVRGGVVLATSHGEVRADRVIVCTNPDASRLLPHVARRTRPVRAQALAAWVDPAPAWRRPTYATRGGDYWRPLPDGRVLLGGMRRADRRRENTRDDGSSQRVQRALDTLLRQLVGRDARIEVTHRWAGTMAFTPDGRPGAGPVPGAPRTHLLAGFNGHGMGWAPGLAAILAAHLQTDGPPPPRAFRPGRNLGGPSGAS